MAAENTAGIAPRGYGKYIGLNGGIQDEPLDLIIIFFAHLMVSEYDFGLSLKGDNPKL
jgi:hypothetical protein